MENRSTEVYDIAVIGGGFYGSAIAAHLSKKFKKIILIEKEADLILKASYNNQARIHNGYHYPRSFVTALRSHLNYAKFVKDYKKAVVDKFLMVYAVAKNNSKISSNQFTKFCHKLGSPIATAPKKIKNIFNDRLIEDVFVVEEAVFDAAELRKILTAKLNETIEILFNTEAIKVISEDGNIATYFSNGQKIISKRVINCTYSGINTLLKNSNFKMLPLKHEATEMPLLEMPPQLKKMGITIMDGPFFSLMPFPDKNLHTFHHVRYTPHTATLDIDKAKNNKLNLPKMPTSSNYIYMIKDAQRYIPGLREAKRAGSLCEIKTVVIHNEQSDARPILFRKDYGIKNFYVVLGGKIDNIYDIFEEIDSTIK